MIERLEASMHVTMQRGFSRVELLMTLACGVLLLVCAAVALPADDKAEPALPKKSTRDAAQVTQIHKAFLVFSNEMKGRFPTPGLINRLPADGGMNIPGRGEEDVTANTTANLFSAMIMQNYFTPELIISPVERNPRVKPAAKFDYEKYQPANDVYWDTTFVADLEKESNVSYAHLPLWGARKQKQWAATMDARFAVLGNRGPRDGKMDPASVTCGPHGNWAGHVIFNDNHHQFFTATAPEELFFGEGDGRKRDNLFAFDDGIDGSDIILTFTKQMTDKGPTIQHD